MTSNLLLTIGTRGSPLALAQTELVRQALAAAHPELATEGAIAVQVVRTTGDHILDRPLADIGGKGLFTKEIEEALDDGRLDIAVHSMKDMPTVLPGGLIIAAMLPRDDPRDALIARSGDSIADLPRGASLGSASLRRSAQMLALRPDLRVRPLRGSVQTRLRKLDEGEVDATLLAAAGLRRLGMIEVASAILPPDTMLPAVGQGAVGVECRAGDERVMALLAAIDDGPTNRCVAAERSMLAVLDGSCHTPIAGFAEESGGRITLRALVAKPDGSVCLRTSRAGAVAHAIVMARDAGEELRDRMGAGFYD